MRFIAEHNHTFCRTRMCAVLDVSTRGLRAYRNRPSFQRQRTDMIVLTHIKEQSRLSLGRYGCPRMTEELKELGLNVDHRRVGRLMRENGISVERSKKYKVTIDSNHAFSIVPNLLSWDFRAAIKPGTVNTSSSSTEKTAIAVRFIIVSFTVLSGK